MVSEAVMFVVATLVVVTVSIILIFVVWMVSEAVRFVVATLDVVTKLEKSPLSA